MAEKLPEETRQLLGMVDWGEFPLCGLLALVNDLFKDLLVPTEEGTDADIAKSICLRLVLAEVSRRAAKLYPPSPVICCCGEDFTTPDELDEHLWMVFMPEDDRGIDGEVHGEVDREWMREQKL